MKAFAEVLFSALAAVSLTACVSNPATDAATQTPTAVTLVTTGKTVALPSELNGEWQDGRSRGWITLEVLKQTSDDSFAGRINFRSQNNPDCKNFVPATGTLQPDGTLKISSSCTDLNLSQVGNRWSSPAPWDGVFLK